MLADTARVTNVRIIIIIIMQNCTRICVVAGKKFKGDGPENNFRECISTAINFLEGKLFRRCNFCAVKILEKTI